MKNDNKVIEFHLYLIPESALKEDIFGILEMDMRVIILELTHISFMVISANVIHFYDCPSLGIKCDAYPSRLNQVSVIFNREGIFYCECSEICSILYSSMHIIIKSVSIEKFIT